MSSTDTAFSALKPAKPCAPSVSQESRSITGSAGSVGPTKHPDHWVEHFGAGAGFWNVMRLYPDQGLGVVLMSNSTTTYDFEPLFALLAGASWS